MRDVELAETVRAGRALTFYSEERVNFTESTQGS
jgi:hypothetical protein